MDRHCTGRAWKHGFQQKREPLFIAGEIQEKRRDFMVLGLKLAEKAERYLKPISPRLPKSRINWAVATSASRGCRR